MSKELSGLEIENITETEAYIDFWVPHANHPETSRPITTFLIGLVPTEKGYYPVELDLTKSQANNIFIVGGPDSRKERFLLSLIRRASQSIAKGYLNLSAITDEKDPNKLILSGWVTKHALKNGLTPFPDGPVAGKILSREPKKIGVDPNVLIIENLGHFLTKTAAQPEKLANLINVLNFKGRAPHLTVLTVESTDLPLLEKNGIGPDITPGIWIFGRTETSGNPDIKNILPGNFRVWDSKNKTYSAIYIVPFQL